KSSADVLAEVPPVVVTATSTVWPDNTAGDTATSSVDELKVTLEAGTAPKLTVLAAVNAVPVIVTDVPPPVGPEVGLRLSTVGTALKVYWSPAFADETPPLVVTITST